jgi:hypothetical protein
MTGKRISQAIRRRRKYAGFFDWPNRRVKESAIVQRLSEALEAAGEPCFVGVEPQESDPPDCVAIASDNRRIAVEVTELVDQKMAAEGQRRPGRHRDWSSADAISRLQEIIDTKNLKCTGLKAYARVLVLIHTDETFLQGYAGDEVLAGVREHVFRKPTNIDEAILLVSYDPRVGTYPYVRLTLN